MGKKPNIAPHVRERIRGEAGRYVAEDLSRVLAAEGIVVHPRTVRAIWAQARALGSPTPAAPMPRPARPADPSPAPAGAPGDALDLLWATVRYEEEFLRGARAENRSDDVRRHTELMFKALGLIDKITPVAPRDPNDAPDVRIAAEKCVAKLHELLERMP